MRKRGRLRILEALAPTIATRAAVMGEVGIRKVSTGIAGLDAQFDGGIPAGSTILLVAEPTNAPYRFLERFAAAGGLAGERVLYYNLERPRREAWERVRSHLGSAASEDAGIHYYDCYSQKLHDLDQAQLSHIGVANHSPRWTEHLLPRLLELAPGQPFRLVLESLSEAIEVYGLEAAMALLRRITSVVRMMDGVACVLLVRGVHEPSVEMRARHLADGVIEFGIQRQGFGLYTFLSVTKMKGVDEECRLFLYKGLENGLWLESTRRVQ